MQLCIILDKSEKNAARLQKLVSSVESSMEYEVFSSVAEFGQWFKKLGEEPPEDEFLLRLIVSSNEILGAKHESLFQKISTYMKDHKYLQEGLEKIPLLIAAHDNEAFDKTEYQRPIFDNVIFKPFDEIVGKGKINFALSGEDALGSSELRKLKPISPLEMLKSVTVDRITELGFRSISTAKIEQGKIARYYLPLLKPLGKDYGVYAVCTSCVPHEDGKRFYCRFSYFGLDSEKSKLIRSLVVKSNGIPLPLDTSESTEPAGAVLIIPEKDRQDRVRNVLDNSFTNINYKCFKTWAEFLSELNPENTLKEWLEPFGEVSPIQLEFDPITAKFLKAHPQEDQGQLLEEYLDLQLEDFANLQVLCQRAVAKERASELESFWNGTATQALPLVLNLRGKTFFLSLESSKVIDACDNHPKRVGITMRPATAEELQQVRGESTIPQNLKFLFVSEIFAQKYTDRIIEFKSAQKVDIIGIGKTKLTLFDQAKKYEGFSDYILDPIDESYLKKRMKYLEPGLISQDSEPSRFCLETHEEIKVGNQVEITNFSEVSISFEYNKELSKGSFREFVILIKADNHFEELMAKSVATEPGEDGKFVNHLTLFGHGDKSNQRIRQWLNEQYVLSKKAEDEAEKESAQKAS